MGARRDGGRVRVGRRRRFGARERGGWVVGVIINLCCWVSSAGCRES